MRDIPLSTLPYSDLRQAKIEPPQPLATTRGAAPGRLDVCWATSEGEVREAQQLRYRVFAEEMGARLKLPNGAPAGHDIDTFDPFCEHLLVRELGQHDRPGQVVGTYRVLTPAAAKRAGGLYSETEFDLTRLRGLRANMVELGRSCIDPAHRSGGVIMLLWGALAEFMMRNNLDTMMGCASVSMCDGGHFAASLWKQLERTHLAGIEWQVQPRLPLPVDELRHDLGVEAPPLIKGYLRCGARILGAPAWDPDFNTADLPMMMRLAELPARYRRHFIE
ncbi:GNAT family N-acetyltransferase [Roseateles oligotrophus]|uniref:L-ornithine N(alpha)-acyltransferase n=1 Tax=Roseateles oligotrophus TaxID=1769250 RepID=A0ABT2YDV7_9BURK|nr:GNAT family N-acyltransferase [Roseateles oligotrophus]MCV2368240.1 GNAT family N-acetyltransferase [Roseateles oligotrophus]